MVVKFQNFLFLCSDASLAMEFVGVGSCDMPHGQAPFSNDIRRGLARSLACLFLSSFFFFLLSLFDTLIRKGYMDRMDVIFHRSYGIQSYQNMRGQFTNQYGMNIVYWP